MSAWAGTETVISLAWDSCAKVVGKKGVEDLTQNLVELHRALSL